VALTPTAKDHASAPALEVRNLAKRFSSQSVIGPLSFAVAAGEFVSLLGPSGCGKTTTLRCIAGFETPTAGSILLNGEPIEALPPNRRNIGLVFQNYALFPHLTIFENVAFGLRLRRIGEAELKQRVGQALELVGLPDLARRYPRQLSGGQQQRIAIARSLVNNPRIILADEPTGALDTRTSIEIMSIFQRLNRQAGLTMIVVTHEPDIAAYAGRNLHFRDGQLQKDLLLPVPPDAAEELRSLPAVEEEVVDA